MSEVSQCWCSSRAPVSKPTAKASFYPLRASCPKTTCRAAPKNINEHCFRVATFAKVELLACYSHSKNRKQRLKTFSTSPWEAYSWDLMGGKYASHGKNWWKLGPQIFIFRIAPFLLTKSSLNLGVLLLASSSRRKCAKGGGGECEDSANIRVFAFSSSTFRAFSAPTSWPPSLHSKDVVKPVAQIENPFFFARSSSQAWRHWTGQWGHTLIT